MPASTCGGSLADLLVTTLPRFLKSKATIFRTLCALEVSACAISIPSSTTSGLVVAMLDHSTLPEATSTADVYPEGSLTNNWSSLGSTITPSASRMDLAGGAETDSAVWFEPSDVITRSAAPRALNALRRRIAYTNFDSA